MKHIIGLTFLLISVSSLAQTADRQLVLLQNNGLLPLTGLDSMYILYDDPTLQKMGERYSQNDGEYPLKVNSVLPGDSVYEEGHILIVYDDSARVSAQDLAVYPAVIYSSHKDTLAADLISQMIFGARAFSDTLTTEHFGYPSGTGEETSGGLRLAFGTPKEAGLDSAYLYSMIDSIAIAAIDSGVAPGIQVLVARNGMVVLHNTYGYQTYDSLTAVDKDMLYDFASVTKITGALPGLMKLYDEGKFSLDATMGTYLSYFDRGNKKTLQYRRILSHNAGLRAWIPYWTTTIKNNGKYRRKTLSTDSTEEYSVKLVDGLYLHKDYREKIYKQIRKSKLLDKQEYVYSGLSFYLYPEIIETLTGQEFEVYVKTNFYKPLGASSLTYNPLRFYPKDQMIPTEIDTFFRKTPLHGVVHDEGAAMMNGVSSNAGLFGTTLDLAKLMQMYLWKGAYGGRQYISENTLELFTACHYCNEGNRRGLAFDKPVIENKENGSTAVDASPHSFGHSGYTGTFTWADPDSGILFVFMSNRVYPTRLNRKLYELNVRPGMHQVVYDAIIDNY